MFETGVFRKPPLGGSNQRIRRQGHNNELGVNRLASIRNADTGACGQAYLGVMSGDVVNRLIGGSFPIALWRW